MRISLSPGQFNIYQTSMVIVDLVCDGGVLSTVLQTSVE